MSAPRIALLHAMPVAVDPVAHVFKEQWPQACVTHLLDDALPRARWGRAMRSYWDNSPWRAPLRASI